MNPEDSSPQHGVLTPFTAFPNVLLDRVMPTLKDTEWRLLCVIVRQTVGWQENGRRRKGRDWITQRQLMVRTGRNSAALSQALDTLVRRQLVNAWDDAGQLLLTPRERRRCSGRVYLGLCQPTMAALQDQRRPESASESEVSDSQSALRKANTTKEKQPKTSQPYGRDSFPSRRKMGRFEPAPDTANTDVPRFLRHYRAVFRQHTGHGEPPVIDWGKDGKLVKHLLTLYPYERLVELLGQFFDSQDEWIRKAGYSLAAFKATIGRLLVSGQRSPCAQVPRSYSSPIIIRSGQWSRASDSLPERYRRREDP